MKDKFILDACCGGRMFWWNKHHLNCIYIDNRIREKGHCPHRPNHSIKPDMVMDFRKLDFPDKSFKLVVFDPPQMIGKPDSCDMIMQFGCLIAETWQDNLKRGFKECWRVLEDYGILIFKWNESSIKKKDVLKLFDVEPLFGHPIQSKIPTHWFCFMKIPEEK